MTPSAKTSSSIRALTRPGLTPVSSPVHTSRPKSPTASSGRRSRRRRVDETAEPFDDRAKLEAEACCRSRRQLPVCRLRRSGARRSRALRRGSKGKAAFTLRLDPERHLKLRLACAVDGRSAQQLVTDALDQLLDGMPELDAMAEKAKRKG